MRERYEEKLNQLNLDLYKMCAKVLEQIDMSIRALRKKDSSLATAVVSEEREVDHMEKLIEGECLQIMLREQPVARDFKKVSSVLKVITDIERIGDHAEDIAELVVSLGEHSCDIKLINEMGHLAKKMLKDSVDAYIREDYCKSEKIADIDDQLDDLFLQVKKQLSVGLTNQNITADEVISLLMISKYLERIGDHAVNISEWALYARPTNS